MRGAVITIVAIAIIVILGIFYYSYQQNSGTPIANNGAGQILPSRTHTVEITSSGFSPSTLEIKKGDIVVFLNIDSRSHWSASAMHPTHRVYPGSDINKCGTIQRNSIFDACRAINTGENFTFQFNEVGSWNYHDHVNINFQGTIVVGE